MKRHFQPTLAALSHVLMLLALLALAPATLAATLTWTGGGATNDWSDAANWTVTSGTDTDGIPDGDDIVVFDASSAKNATIDAAFTISQLQIDATYGGTVSLGANTLTINAAFTVAIIGGFDAGTGLVLAPGNITVDSLAPLYDFQKNDPNSNITVDNQPLVVNNTFTLNNTNTINGTSARIQVAGDVTTSDGNGYSSGVIELNGSTDQTISGNGRLTDIDVQKSGGDVLMPDELDLDNNADITGSGLFKNTGGALHCRLNCTFDFTGSVDDFIKTDPNSVITVNTQPLVVNNTFTLNTINVINGTSARIQVAGDVTTSDGNGYSSGVIELNGSTDQTISGNGRLTDIDVQKSGGDVLMPDELDLDNNADITGSGLFKNTGGALHCRLNCTFDFTGSVDDFIKTDPNSVITVNTQPLVVNNTFTLNTINVINGTSARIQVAGDVTTSDGNGYSSGVIELNGSTDQTISGNGRLTDIDVQKSGGDVLMPDELDLDNNADITGSGLFKNTGGALHCRLNCTFDFTGSVDDFIKTDPNSVITVNTQPLVVNNTFTLNTINVINGTSARIQVAGDVTTSDGNGYSSGVIELNGSTDQTISGNGRLTDIDVQKSGGDVLMPDELDLDNNADITGSGLFKNTGGALHCRLNCTFDFTGSVDDFIKTDPNSVITVNTQPLVVNNTFTLNTINVINGTSARIQVAGDVTTSDGNGYSSGVIELNGSTDQTISGNGRLTDIDVQKSGGDVLMPDELDLDNNADITGSGLFKNTGGALHCRLNCTFDFTGSVDDFIKTDPNSVITVNTQPLVVNNTFTLNTINVINGTSARIQVAGDVTTNDSNGYSSGVIELAGANNQVLSGTGDLTKVDVGKTGGGVSGTMDGDLTVLSGGTLSPGASPGTLTIDGNLTFAAGSTLGIDVNGDTPGTDHDQLIVNGTVTINGGTISGTTGGGVSGPIDVIANDNTDAINGTFDGLAEGAQVTLGTGTYSVSYVGGDGNDLSLSAVILTPSIAVNTDATFYWPLDPVALTVDISNANNLLGVSADLGYPDATYTASSLAAGALLDDGTMLVFDNDDGAGTLSWSVSRTGSTGATGSGEAASASFTIDAFATPGTASFSQSDLAAVEPDGTPITFDANTPAPIEIGGVWPGDADNDCTVEAADLLPLGTNFGDTGPARAGFDLSWGAKGFSPWGGSSTSPDFAKSFIDTDGDGEIDEGDLLGIGVNFGETHAESTGCDDGVARPMIVMTQRLRPVAVPSLLFPGDAFTVEIRLGDTGQPIDDLFGVSFELAYNTAGMTLGDVAPGPLLNDGTTLLELDAFIAQTPGLAPYALTRTKPNPGIDGNGTAVAFSATVPAGAAPGPYVLSLAQTLVVNVAGQQLNLNVQSFPFSVGTQAQEIVPAGDPDPVTFEEQGVEVDFSQLDEDVNLIVKEFDGAVAEDLPEDLEVAVGSIWTVELEGEAPGFTADICVALDAGSVEDPTALNVIKRPNSAQPWNIVISELRPDADSPTQICAVDVTSFSDFALTQPGEIPLPVELSSFTAQLDGDEVLLDWATASETINAGFEVQTQDAEASWTTHGFVEGHSTTSQPQQYSYRIADVPLGLHRFRLKQIDFNGTFAYSETVEVRVELPDSYALSSVYPNPFNPQAVFTLAVSLAQPVQIEVYNILGQRVKTLHTGPLEAHRAHRFTLEAGGLPSGLYLIHVTGTYFSDTRQVVLMK